MPGKFLLSVTVVMQRLVRSGARESGKSSIAEFSRRGHPCNAVHEASEKNTESQLSSIITGNN